MKIDKTNFNELVLETAKEYGENPEDYKDVKIAGALNVTKDDGCVTIILEHENRIGIGKGTINMQKNPNCFEAWSVIFYVYILKKQGTVILDTAPDLELPEFDLTLNKKRNYSRFLYRVLRFSEQYPWFEIGENLKRKVDEFAEFLKDNTFINHVRGSESVEKGIKEGKTKQESKTEKAFAGSRSGELWKLLEEKGIKRCGNQKIYSQLWVGMGSGDTTSKRSTSAVDLWTISGDTICPIELKTNNSMVGTISEIFFYSNYMYDFFTSGNQSRLNFIPNNPTKEPEDSGYSLLTDPQKSYKRIAGFMLLDKPHPFCKSPYVLEVLNDNKAGGVDIRYDLIIYPEETK